MGIIINLPNNVTHYASTRGKEVFIQKEPLPVYDDAYEDPPTYVYRIEGGLTVWDDLTSYQEGDLSNNVYTNLQVTVTSNTVPQNLYTSVYNEFKSGVNSYVDDI